MSPELHAATFFAAGALLWAAVLHAWWPRLAWSVPAGVAVAGAALWLSPREPGVLAFAAGGISAAAALGIGATLVARRLVRRPRGSRPAPAAPAPIIRLWRGDVHALLAGLSLALWIAVAVWGAAVVSDIPMHRHARLAAIGVVGLWTAGPLGVGIGLLGLWRSLRSDAPHEVPRLLAWPARLGILGSGAVFGLLICAVIPDLLEGYWPLAFGASERERYLVRVLRDGRELEVSGEMGFGLTEDVAAALAAHPSVRILHLDSPGGRVLEGEQLAALVQERRLATYVSDECASACVLPLAAGTPRLLSTGARVGLHGYRTWLDTVTVRLRLELQQVATLRKLGIEESFARRAAATPHWDIWWPTHDELFASGMADRHARSNEVALSGVPPEDLRLVPIRLREQELFQAMFEFERPVFERLAEAMTAGHERGLSEQEALAPVVAEIAAMGERIMDDDLPRASDEALRRMFAVSAKAYGRWRTEHPDGCADALRTPAAMRALGDEAADALAEVLVSSRLEPVAAPAFDPDDPVLLDALDRSEERAQGWSDVPDEGASPAQECLKLEGTVAFLEELLALPPAVGTPLLRAMAALPDDPAPGGGGGGTPAHPARPSPARAPGR